MQLRNAMMHEFALLQLSCRCSCFVCLCKPSNRCLLHHLWCVHWPFCCGQAETGEAPLRGVQLEKKPGEQQRTASHSWRQRQEFAPALSAGQVALCHLCIKCSVSPMLPISRACKLSYRRLNTGNHLKYFKKSN